MLNIHCCMMNCEGDECVCVCVNNTGLYFQDTPREYDEMAEWLKTNPVNTLTLIIVSFIMTEEISNIFILFHTQN